MDTCPQSICFFLLISWILSTWADTGSHVSTHSIRPGPTNTRVLPSYVSNSSPRCPHFVLPPVNTRGDASSCSPAAGDKPLPPLAGDEPPPLLAGRRQRLCPPDMDPGVQRPSVSSSPSLFSIYYISAVHDLLLLDFFGPHFLFLCPFSIYSVFAFLNFFLIFFVCSGWRLASPNMSRWRLLFPFSIYSIYSAAWCCGMWMRVKQMRK